MNTEVECPENNLGISSFIRFIRLRDFNQTKDYLAEPVRNKIAQSLRERFTEVFIAQFPDGTSKAQFDRALCVAICPKPKRGFSDNEVHFWSLVVPPLRKLSVFKIMNNLREHTKNPINVNIEEGKSHEIILHGWGFYYY